MTPRRIILTIIALVVFGTAYSAYDRFLGWVDGLPVLPERMVVRCENEIRPPPRATSPTIDRLEEAYGKHSPETEPAWYPTQLEFRNETTSTVIAAGRPPSSPGSNRVTLIPFSAAVFGKPRPDYQRQPGEVAEITTIHADKAILEFDKPIMIPADMNTAKLVRLELISDPEQTLPDPRKGHVYITNNQRSSDPNRRLVLKTVGPVFYRDTTIFVHTAQAAAKMKETKVPEGVVAKLEPLSDKEFDREDFVRELTSRLTDKELERWKNTILNHAAASPTGPRPRGPDIWTDAPIEAVDHSNIPRKEGSPSETAPIVSEEARNPGTVAGILGGQRLPPPTVTGVGMKVFLVSGDSAKDPKVQKKSSGGFSGVRRIELLEQVVMHLWMEAGQGLVGSEGKSAAIPEPPEATAALTGSLGPVGFTARQFARDLLQIETRGKFVFDAEKNTARFDVLPQVDPNLTNDVRATKIPAKPGLQTLFSEVLEIEFKGSPVGSTDAQPPPPKPVAPKAGEKAAAKPSAGPQFKRLHAWTYTPGRLLTISSDTDQMQSYGQDLVRVQATDTAPETTRLTGSPLWAVQQRSELTAGTPTAPGVLLIEAGAGAPDRKTTIEGAGELKLWDPAAKASTMAASWKKSMVQTKVQIDNRELDLYTLTDRAEIKDLQSDYQLNGDVIKLWMAPTAPAAETAPKSAAAGPATPGSRMQIHKLEAKGQVTAHSGDMDVDHAETLTAYFRDIPPPRPPEPGPGAGAPGSPKQPQEPSTTLPPEPGQPGPPPSAQPAGPPEAAADGPPEPQKPKPPMKIRAREINTWVVRYPLPKPPERANKPPEGPGKPQASAKPGRAGAPGESTSGGMKYQLERARCEGMVYAHQDPDDPSKPRGTDIIGSLMLIDSQPDGSGSRLTVFGWENIWGEVHNEGTSLTGPKVLVDQIHNLAVIEGRGAVVLPGNSDLSGAEKKPDQKDEPVKIHFRDGMKFEGSLKVAEFSGKVSAVQGESSITCDRMKVNLDRPVYFSQMNRPASKPTSGPAGKPQARPAAKPPAAGGPAANPVDDDKAKIDVIYCYPTSDDKAETEQEKLVYFVQIEREPGAGKLVRKQQLVAQELTIHAQVKDDPRVEPYRLVLAEGPGTTRMWAPESKDDDSSGGSPPPSGSTKAGPGEVEMKLTTIAFSGRMIAKDKGDIFKEATFLDSVHVLNLPTDNPDLQVDRLRLPPAAIQLTCRDRLIVSTHKNPRHPDGPAIQSMHARGNAYLQNDEYDGWGEEIRSEGKVVWFDGAGQIPARIKSRFRASDNSGKQIRLNRGNNEYTVIGGIGGTFIEGNGGGNESGLKTLPPPAPPSSANKSATPTPKGGTQPGSGTTPGQNPNQTQNN